jgi:hypothetical protein
MLNGRRLEERVLTGSIGSEIFQERELGVHDSRR